MVLLQPPLAVHLNNLMQSIYKAAGSLGDKNVKSVSYTLLILSCPPLSSAFISTFVAS